nr:hypothetical protein BN444_03615 [Xanthomonas translucens pv. translucens DSM 18974]
MVAPGLRAGKRGFTIKNAALQPDFSPCTFRQRGAARASAGRADALRERALA